MSQPPDTPLIVLSINRGGEIRAGENLYQLMRAVRTVKYKKLETKEWKIKNLKEVPMEKNQLKTFYFSNLCIFAA